MARASPRGRWGPANSWKFLGARSFREAARTGDDAAGAQRPRRLVSAAHGHLTTQAGEWRHACGIDQPSD